MADLWVNPALARAKPCARRSVPPPVRTGLVRRPPASPLARDLATLRLDPAQPPRDGGHLVTLLSAAWPHAGPDASLLGGWGWDHVAAYRRVREQLPR